MYRILNSPSFTTLINLSVKGLALVLINPFLFKIFSNEEVVVWYLILSAVSIQLIFDFGLLPNSTRILSRKIGEFELKNITFEDINRFKDQTFSVYILFSLTIFLATIIVANSYLVPKTEYYINEYLLYSILGLGCIGIFNNYYGTILQSIRKVEVLQRNLALTSLISILLATASLFITQDIGITLFLLFSNHIINFLVLQKILLKDDRVRKFSVSFLKTFKDNELLNSSIRSGVGILFSLGFFHLINFYVADEFSSAEAAQFMLFMQIIRAMSSFSQAPFYAFIPNYNYLYGLNQGEKLFDEINKRLNHSLTLFLALAVIFSLALPLLFQIVDVKNSFELNRLWKTLVIAFFLERISASLVQIITISKKIIWHWYNIILATLMTFIYLFLLDTNNIASIPIAIGTVYMTIGIPICLLLLYRKMKFIYSKQLKIQFLIAIALFSLLYASF